MTKASEFLIRSKSGVDIPAAGMKGREGLILQRKGQFDEEVTDPLQFKRISTVQNEKCSEFIENTWYEGLITSRNPAKQYIVAKSRAILETDRAPAALHLPTHKARYTRRGTWQGY